ncbi:SDR family oxidoreductase [Streptomyces klenkii]|uniref:SDR family oxidoreductase n=1 Tax=Streptomyces klenkii TaxID=1420899 RepID=UPI0033A17808
MVTGATGFLGCRLVRELLARTGDEVLIVLGRGSQESLRARTEAAVTSLDTAPLPVGALDRLRFVSADITQPGLGLSASDRAWVTDGLTQVWHSAALLGLDSDPVALYRSNVLGTRHVLDLADAAPRAHLVHVSTAYVAGRRLTGHIREDDLREDAGFQVPYEETKYTAETMVHAWAQANRRTATIMRPSLLVTDHPAPPGLPCQPLETLTRLIDDAARSWSVRGKKLADLLTHSRGLKNALRVRVAADLGGALNLLQADYAAHAMVRATQNTTGARLVRTLHITHSENTATTTVRRALEQRYPGLQLIAVLELPDPTPIESLVAQRAQLFGYTAQRRTYDRTHFLKAVGDLPGPKPIDETYLARGLTISCMVGRGTSAS